MNKFLFILTILSPYVFGQKINNNNPIEAVDLKTCKSDFETIPLYSSSSDEVEKYLMKKISNLKNNHITLRLINETESLTGTHLLFQQLYNNIPIYRSDIKVNIDKQNKIRSTFDNTYHVSSQLSETFPSDDVKNNFLSSVNHLESAKTERNYFFDNNVFLPVWRIEITTHNIEYYETIIDVSGKILYQKDLNCYYKKSLQDSIVGVSIFLPDPLTTAEASYGSPYIDSSDFDVPQINNQKVNALIKVDFTNDTFRLQNSYVTIKEFSNPSSPPVFCSHIPDFNYTRSQQGFEDVNAFYHISAFQQYIQQNLGFNNLVNYSIWADTHGNNGADNSMFSGGFSPPRLTFGEGGVDDAEDADVILHEYGHAISNSAAPNTNSGTQRQSLDEANGDYFASSYSRSINPFKWENVFSWDAHNQFWDGRFSISTKHYPEDLVYNLYEDADIWSATIMQIWGDIGREASDRILMESMFSYSSNMKMSDAAVLYVMADSMLYNGNYHVSICNRFNDRGLLINCINSVGINEKENNTDNISFFHSNDFSEAIFQFKTPVSAIIELSDMQGRKMSSIKATEISEYKMNTQFLSPGMYLVTIYSLNKINGFKLLKF